MKARFATARVRSQLRLHGRRAAPVSGRSPAQRRTGPRRPPPAGPAAVLAQCVREASAELARQPAGASVRCGLTARDPRSYAAHASSTAARALRAHGRSLAPATSTETPASSARAQRLGLHPIGTCRRRRPGLQLGAIGLPMATRRRARPERGLGGSSPVGGRARTGSRRGVLGTPAGPQQFEVEDGGRQRGERRGQDADDHPHDDADARPGRFGGRSRCTQPTTTTSDTSTRITPNTCQPLPRTSSRLRPSAADRRGARARRRGRHRPHRQQDQAGDDRSG